MLLGLALRHPTHGEPVSRASARAGRVIQLLAWQRRSAHIGGMIPDKIRAEPRTSILYG